MSTKTKEEATAKHQVPTLHNIDVSRIIIGLTEIGKLDIEDFRLNYSITKTITNLNEVSKAYEKSVISLTKKHVKSNDNGNFEVENGYYVFKSKKDKEEYDAAKSKLDAQVSDAKIWTLKTSVLKDIKGVKSTHMAMCAELIVDDANILAD